MDYSGSLAAATETVRAAGGNGETHAKMLNEVCDLINNLRKNIEKLEAAVNKVSSVKNTKKKAENYRDVVIPAMNAVRQAADKLETIVDAEMWPLPTYAEMLFLR